MINPAWLDHIVTFPDSAGDAEPVVFTVELDGTELYRGRLLCLDGTYSFNLAEIIRDTLGQVFPPCLSSGRGAYPAVTAASAAPDVRHGILVRAWYERGSESAPDFAASPVFVYDWSYDEGARVDALRSDPIDGILHPLQYVILSAFDDLDVPVITHREGLPSDYNDDFNADFGGGDIVDTMHLAAKTNTVLPPGTWAGRVRVGAVDFEVLPCTTARYVLHYVNALGGWDSFVPRALCRQTDGLSRSEYSRRAVNVSGGAWAPRRGRTVYDVSVQRRWEMHTAWLTEAQAARMHHLLESPEVWIYDTRDARFIPVVLTDTDCEWKTHAGEGRKLISYTLNIEEAIGRTRR